MDYPSGFTANYKVFATIDGGNSWINLSSGLPNLPANTIVYENNSPDGIYLGMDVGVYYRDTIINQWIPFMLNLPNVIVKELEIFYAGNKIRAATYGRGIWESPLYKLANSISKPLAEKTMELSIRPNPSRGIFELYLENQLIMDTQIEIYNSTGTLIKQLIISNTNNYKLDLTSEAAGLYYMKILNNQSSSTYKLIIN
ncbi:MAG: T9SS type A sorting domain-containing protein [Burkholderiaceae bacterium]|nr:T9SS type A sorting domain-containing protein [Burkholderiaceae bacterium]